VISDGPQRSPSSFRLRWRRPSTTRVVLLLLFLYPLFELFVWIPLTLTAYCPKPGSHAAQAMERFNRFQGMTSVLVADHHLDPDQDRDPLYAIGRLNDTLAEVTIPVSRIPATGYFNFLSSRAQDAKFVVFRSLPINDEGCVASENLIAETLSTLLPGVRTAVEEHIQALEKQGRCLAINFSDTVHADYLDMLAESEISTSVGRIKIREAIEVPLVSGFGEAVQSGKGWLYPTVPVARFLVRSLSNGYIDCD
jgi:hypothetical protein